MWYRCVRQANRMRLFEFQRRTARPRIVRVVRGRGEGVQRVLRGGGGGRHVHHKGADCVHVRRGGATFRTLR